MIFFSQRVSSWRDIPLDFCGQFYIGRFPFRVGFRGFLAGSCVYTGHSCRGLGVGQPRNSAQERRGRAVLKTFEAALRHYFFFTRGYQKFVDLIEGGYRSGCRPQVNGYLGMRKAQIQERWNSCILYINFSFPASFFTFFFLTYFFLLPLCFPHCFFIFFL